MKNSTQYIIDLMKSLIRSYENNPSSFGKMEEVFKLKISKEQLIYCLTDDGLDADDVSACKEMLKFYYNYESTVN